MGYASSSGNTLLDPTVPIDDLESKLHSVAGAGFTEDQAPVPEDSLNFPVQSDLAM